MHKTKSSISKQVRKPTHKYTGGFKGEGRARGSRLQAARFLVSIRGPVNKEKIEKKILILSRRRKKHLITFLN